MKYYVDRTLLQIEANISYELEEEVNKKIMEEIKK